MNHDDERDFEEEAANRRDIEREHAEEAAAQQAVGIEGFQFPATIKLGWAGRWSAQMTVEGRDKPINLNRHTLHVLLKQIEAELIGHYEGRA